MKTPIPAIGRRVIRCVIADWAFWLEFFDPSDGFDANIQIERPFEIARGEHVLRFTDTDCASLGQAAFLVGRVVLEACAEPDGTLRLVFDDASVLVVRPDWNFEAWVLEAKDDRMIICMPGGRIAILEDERPSSRTLPRN